MTCTVEGCASKVLARGLCSKHYQREYKRGSTDETRGGTVFEKYKRHVIQRGPAECWGWTGQVCSRMGYGRIHEGGYGSPRVFAHRVSYETHIGPIPEGRYVLHRCDNPPCTNPAHLFLGSLAENIADMDAKGRRRPGAPRGENHPKSKLTPEAVREIRTSAEGQRALGRKYGVSKNAIAAIRRGKNWAHL